MSTSAKKLVAIGNSRANRWTCLRRMWALSTLALAPACDDRAPVDSAEGGLHSPRSEVLPADEIEEGSSGGAGDVETEVRDPDAANAGRELVYEKVLVENESGEMVSSTEVGELDLETWRKVSRPYTHLQDEYLYEETVTSVVDAEGTRTDTYRVTRVPNVDPPAEPSDDAPLVVRPTLLAAAEEAGPDDSLDVLIKLRGAPDWDVPLLPEVGMWSAETYAAAVEQREVALAEREEAFLERSSSLAAQIVESGGTIRVYHWTTGWLGASVSKGLLEELQAREDITKIDLDDVGLQSHGSRAIGIHRDSRSYTDAQTYIDAGFNAENGAGQITIGIQEQWHFNDEACFFDDDSGCETERLLGRWKCWVEYCESYSQANYSEASNVNHGTVVSSIAVGDYTQDQAQGLTVCDSTTNHSASWENSASGYGKEAVVQFFDHQGSTLMSRHVMSTSCLQGIDIELTPSGPGSCYLTSIISSSNGWNDGDSYPNATCDATSSYDLEDAYEGAFDDGIFIAVSAGNNGTTGSSCNMSSPADIPKTFSVNGLSTDDTLYSVMDIDDTYASRGGGSIQSPDGTTVGGALSMADLAAPSAYVNYVTSGSGTNGCVSTGQWVGTSFAAPAVAGMAALVKDWGLNDGQTWISNVGRLHTVMLGMGDRGNSSGTKNVVGADNLFGLGRAKLRLLSNGSPSFAGGALSYNTYTFTSGTADQQYIAFGGPVATGTEEVKCVMMAIEDMSGKDNISRIDLELRLRPKQGNGTCAVGYGTPSYTRINADHDHKKMVAFEDSLVNVEDTCVEVTVDKEWVSSSGSAVVHVFCMATSEVDNEPDGGGD
ncbi:MAG: S8 family serine peptidase [Deltaproteobacteria bacterium]|nr:S8 family serine peptidase [Deltaproteobacteria bacterium]MBK8235074.1 S8 family serine peptidase [Deltaproteobacteria bacterium]MBK8716611.1 S8 family serine peptidase [Deltaproteobacteria bacterium]MBP7290209.1 S8 family serine peptidase [Nannocystaceae bacterium]